jgi:hypothetical protein
MELNGVSASISPIRNGSIVQPQASPTPPENEPEVTGEEDEGGKANGVINKLNGGDHFKGVAAVRLLISHFDNEGLDKIDPALLPAPEDNNGKAYEKFLEQYRALYDASQPSPDPPVVPEPDPNPAAIVEPLSEPEVPVIEIPPVPEEPPVAPVAEEPANEVPPVPEEQPVVEVPLVPEEPPVAPVAEEPVTEVPAADTIFVTPLEIEPVATPPATPVDEGEGILAAFEELWDAQALEEKPETLDIVM